MSLTLLNNIQQLPPDALFGIKQRYTQDSRANKVDLGIGAYRDDKGKPWVLPSVRSAEKLIHEDPNYNHEYLGINGLPELSSAAAKIVFGEDSKALQQGRIASVQSLSGTGALHIAAKFISSFLPGRSLYISEPTWANHNAIFKSQGVQTATYPYWQASTKTLDMEGFLKTIKDAPTGSVILLHACAHNPTGLDPTQDQWSDIIDAVASKDHIVLFDSAYQGFASGDLDRDAYAIRLGVEKLARVSPIFVCQSFAKNVGMYGERAGCFHLVLPEQENIDTAKVKSAITSQLSSLIRSEVSNPPAYGAKIVAKILNSPELTKQWHQDMITMSSRITEMRHELRDRLVAQGTPGTWDHIVEQCGMFSYTGLSPEMVKRLETQHAVYLVSSGRASIAGLNHGNIEHVAKAIDEVVRHFTGNSKF